VEGDDDAVLLGRYRDGDRAAFATLVTRYQGPIYNAAYRVLGNREDAADVAQVVFLKVAERADEFDPRFRFFSWIYRIAVNEALNQLRRNGRDEPIDEDDDFPAPESEGPERQASQAELARRVHGVLHAMRADDRVMIMLRHFSSCSYGEIGEILGIGEATVKSRLHEARQRMKPLFASLREAI
jgi:RNA polymerase sigma-70 factor (ECF subfamily)